MVERGQHLTVSGPTQSRSAAAAFVAPAATQGQHVHLAWRQPHLGRAGPVPGAGSPHARSAACASRACSC
ncbi:hypothetical protein [Streptomyces sp. NPDC045251]|uniref:hypothetical protein n=1 Tax=unclassified Streptomyces TaxID=2593676 RepID=UPI0033D858A3